MCFARCELLSGGRTVSDGEGPWPTPWSSHTCTEAKSPEAQAPRIAAPTRTDSTSCDRTTGMPAQDKDTPWLGSKTGALTVWSQQAAPAAETPDVKAAVGVPSPTPALPGSIRFSGSIKDFTVSAC